MGAGAAMVGERGPELVMLPPGSNVIPNMSSVLGPAQIKQSTPIGPTASEHKAAMSMATSMLASEKSTSASSTTNSIQRNASSQQISSNNIPVVLQVDGRELGRVVVDLLNGLASAMAYLGAKDIKELQKKGRFIFQTHAGYIEGAKKI